MGDDAIHQGHCTRYVCVYGDPQCPVHEVTLPGGRAEKALAVLRTHADGRPRRFRECAEKFGISGEFHDHCCRFPKTCSPYPYDEAFDAGNVAEENLEPRREAVPVRRPVDTTPELSTEFAVRNAASGWVYALPKVLPKFLGGQRGTREAAEWHRRQVGGPDPEDQAGFEIVSRPVGPWEVVR